MGNPVVHFELIGPDPARLRDFYSRLFGWDAPPGAPVAEAVSSTSEYSFITPSEQAPPAAGGIGGGPGYDTRAIFYVGVTNVARRWPAPRRSELRPFFRRSATREGRSLSLTSVILLGTW